MKLAFYGESDDLFYMDKDGTPAEELYPPRQAFKILAPADEGGVIVFARYGEHEGACWGIGIEPLDEDVPMPEWPISMRLGGRGYSTRLEMHVPSGVIIDVIDAEQEP